MADLKYDRWVISDFSGGLNTRWDPRVISPNKNGEKAESPAMENMDIVQGGALVTSSGFEKVSERGSGTGAIKNLLYYNKDDTTKQLIITHDDDHFYITPSNATWQTVGDYGTVATNVGGVVFKGTAATRWAILGNDIDANITKKWDGTTMSDIAGSPPDGHINAEWMGRLFSGGEPGSKALSAYSDVEDEDDFAGGGTIGWNDIIRGYYPEGEVLHVFFRDYNQGVRFTYNDSFALSTPLKDPFVRDGGSYNHKVIAGSFNKVYFFGPQGVLVVGTDTEYANNNTMVDSLSWKIKPSLDDFNFAQESLPAAVFYGPQRQYLLSIPATNDGFNSKVFVYNLDYDAWTVRTGIFAADWETFPASTGEELLIYGSSLEPAIYKFNSKYTYDGFAYKRSWKSKVFNFGAPLNYKDVDYIEIAGAMSTDTEFKVIVTADGEEVVFLIDSTHLQVTASGGFYGDGFYGDQYYGGPAIETFYRYYARIPVPDTIRRAKEYQVEFTNTKAGQPFKVDSFAWHYAMLADSYMDDKFINTNITV